MPNLSANLRGILFLDEYIARITIVYPNDDNSDGADQIKRALRTLRAALEFRTSLQVMNYALLNEFTGCRRTAADLLAILMDQQVAAFAG